MVVTELGENFAKAQMTIDESFLNGLDIPMGGVYFTLEILPLALQINILPTEL